MGGEWREEENRENDSRDGRSELSVKLLSLLSRPIAPVMRSMLRVSTLRCDVRVVSVEWNCFFSISLHIPSLFAATRPTTRDME